MINKIVIPIVFFLFLLLVWQVSTSLFDIKEYMLPSPTDILGKLFDSYELLIKHASATLFEAVAGFILGTTLALAIAFVITYSSLIGLMIFPLVILIQTTPKIAIAPFLVIWLGFGFAPKIVVAATLVFFPIVIGTIKGLKTISPELLDLMNSYGANKWEMLFKVRIPSALPYIFTAFKIAAAASVIGAVVGEFVGADIGLGYLILVANTNFDTSLMFASLTLLAIMGITFFFLVGATEKRVLYWQKSENGFLGF